MKFIDIPEDRQREAINTVALQTGLPPSSIEKDWWVTQMLKALHTLPYAEHIAFKGGTSLSKCWNLIARFSEDVDIALSREFLGFGGELSKTQISDRLRRSACSFVREKMRRIFFTKSGFSSVSRKWSSGETTCLQKPRRRWCLWRHGRP